MNDLNQIPLCIATWKCMNVVQSASILVSIGTADVLAPVRGQGISCANADQDPVVKKLHQDTMLRRSCYILCSFASFFQLQFAGISQ